MISTIFVVVSTCAMLRIGIIITLTCQKIKKTLSNSNNKQGDCKPLEPNRE